VTVVTFILSIGTFKDMAGLSSDNPMALFIIYFLLNAGMLLVYVILQIVLVLNTLDDMWPLGTIFLFLLISSAQIANMDVFRAPIGDIVFGTIFFVLGQVFQLAFSAKLCEAANHYIDGMFFGTICSLLGVMMVYKYWDSITKEDLEFSVGAKANVWEIRDEYQDTTLPMPPVARAYGRPVSQVKP
jgi:hypothetical protein